jgi:putative transposase
MVTPAARRRAAGHLIETHAISERRACRVVKLYRSVARYRTQSKRNDGELRQRMKALAQQYPRYGYLMLHQFLSQEGLVINRKRTYRIYTELGLQVRTKRRKKLKRPRIPMLVPTRPNERWSVDFMSDQLANGRRFRILNIVDDFSRKCIGQIVDTSISGQRLARFLDELGETGPLPKVIVCDNGSELTSKAMFFWSQKSGTKLHFIQPGKPMQNAFVESFNGTFRDNCLNEHWFRDLHEARQIINAWRNHYNHVRPHSSLGYVSPEKYAQQAA